MRSRAAMKRFATLTVLPLRACHMRMPCVFESSEEHLAQHKFVEFVLWSLFPKVIRDFNLRKFYGMKKCQNKAQGLI